MKSSSSFRQGIADEGGPIAKLIDGMKAEEMSGLITNLDNATILAVLPKMTANRLASAGDLRPSAPRVQHNCSIGILDRKTECSNRSVSRPWCRPILLIGHRSRKLGGALGSRTANGFRRRPACPVDSPGNLSSRHRRQNDRDSYRCAADNDADGWFLDDG
jgi:hypothetical protein